MKEFLHTLGQYADQKVDLTALRRSIEQQLVAMPAAAPDILAAIAAAERAGKIDAGETQVQAEWLRSRSSVQPLGAQDTAADQTGVRVPADIHAKPPSAQSEAAPNERERTGMNSSARAPVGEGSVLKSRYLLEEQIGAGGMGVVFRARDLEQQRIGGEVQYVAIKLLQPEFREYRDAIFEEMRKTRDLAHQNIVIARDCQQDGEDIFMTMEYLQGKTLDTLLDEDFARGMPWEFARPIIEGMGRGLAYAHDRGVIHCDFKPPNVFITQSFSPKILDFGIARAARAGNRRSKSGLPVGLSRRYASTEMIRAWNSGALEGYRPDTRDDIYALSCVVFELLTGRHPFGDLDAEQARQQQLACASVPGLSPRQNSAIAKAMAFDRALRTARVEDLLHDLVPNSAAPAPRAALKWLWPAAAGSAAVLIALAVALWLRSRMEVAQPSVAPPSVAATRERDVTSQARNLVGRLGIDAEPVDAGAIKTDADLLQLIRSAARHVQLGSTPVEIQAALKLCGQFTPKCPRDLYGDEQVRESTLMPFVLDTMPVTVRDFEAFVAATHYRTGAERRGWAYAVRNDGSQIRTPNGNWRNAVNLGQARDDWPVVAVTFDDAQAYCIWTGKRLPTEDQWEYAARGPERHLFAWGNDKPPAVEQSLQPPAVGAGPKEGIGGRYRDLSGVVWEWVNTDVSDQKVLKGGSWLESNPANRRAAVHRYEKPETADADTGFRCAATATAWPDADYWLSQS